MEQPQPPPVYRAPAEVALTVIRIPFWDLVMLLVKLALASIPAMIITAIIGFLLAAVGLAALAALGVAGGGLAPK